MKDARGGLRKGGDTDILCKSKKRAIGTKEKGGLLVATPVMLANNILRRAFRTGTYVTPIKLQKLLWFTYSEFFERTKYKTLLFDEMFRAYPNGPVSVTVKDAFQHFDEKNITKYARESQEKVFIADEKLSPLLREVLDHIWEKYGSLPEDEVVDESHKEGGAWRQVREETNWCEGNWAFITPDHVKRGIENEQKRANQPE